MRFKKVQEGSRRSRKDKKGIKKVQVGSRRFKKVLEDTTRFKKGQDGPRKFMNVHLFKNVKGEMIFKRFKMYNCYLNLALAG